MSEFSSPSQVLRLLVNGGGQPDPPRFDLGGAEAAQRAAAWERQIESFDQKEVELHQTQMRLMREQTATFIRDLTTLQQEVTGLKMRQDATGSEAMSQLEMKNRELKLWIEKENRERDSAFESLHSRLLAFERDGPGKREMSELKLSLRELPVEVQELKLALEREADERASAVLRLERRCGELASAAGEHSRNSEDFSGRVQRSMEKMDMTAATDRFDCLLKDMDYKLSSGIQDVDSRMKAQMMSVDAGLEDLRKMVMGQKSNADKDMQGARDRLAGRIDNLEHAMGEAVGSVKQHGSHHATLVERVQALERSHNDASSQHRASLEAASKNLDRLHAQCSEHSSKIAHHASMGERMDYLEKLIGDSADRHAQNLDATHQRLLNRLQEMHTELHGRVQSCEKHGQSMSDLQNDLKARDQHGSKMNEVTSKLHGHHAALTERVDYLENAMGDSADKHWAEIQALKAAHEKHLNTYAKHTKEVDSLKGTTAHHASIAERLQYVEKLLGDSADQHSEELSHVKSKHEHAHNRLSALEAQCATLGKSIATLASEKKSLATTVNSLKERCDHIEGLHGDSTESLQGLKDSHDRHLTAFGRHTKDFDALKQQHLRHASMGERVDYIERLLGDSADKHAAELDDVKAHLDRAHSRMSEYEKLHGHVSDLKKGQAALAKEKADLVAHHATVQERLDYLERLLGDSADKHAQELAELKLQHDRHATAFSRHSKDLESFKNQHQYTVEERLGLIEKGLHDISAVADKRAGDLQGVLTRFDGLNTRLQAVEGKTSSIGDLHRAVSGGRGVSEEHHATLQERVDYLEGLVGDSADKHAKELKSLKEAHAKHLRENESLKAAMAHHATVYDRLDYLEKLMGDSADKHAAELAAAKERLEHMHGRLSTCEAHGAALGELKKAHSGLSSEKAKMELHHASLRERVDYLETMVGDSADKHAKLLEAAHAKLDLMHGRVSACEKHGQAVGDLRKQHGEHAQAKSALEMHHATMKERMDYIEGLLGDSMDKHTRELEALKHSHDQHRQDMTKHQREVEAMKAAAQHHATFAERLSYMETLMGDSADKHAAELAAHAKKVDHLHSKFAEERDAREKHHNTLKDMHSKDREKRDAHAKTLSQRVEELEAQLGEHANKHAQELADHRSAVGKLASDVKASQSQAVHHGTIAERIEDLERGQADTARKLGQEIVDTHKKIDNVFARFAAVRDAWGGVEVSPPRSPLTSGPLRTPGSPLGGRRGF